MYLDPSAGSLVFQVAAGFALAVLSTFGRVRHAVRDVFLRFRGRRGG